MSQPLRESKRARSPNLNAEQGGNKKTKLDGAAAEELSNLSISDKLLKGISVGFEKNQAYAKTIHSTLQANPRLRTQGLEHDMLTVNGMQRIADLAQHVDPRLETNAAAHEIATSEYGPGPCKMMHPSLQDDHPPRGRSLVRQFRVKEKHKQGRMPYVMASSQRLQAHIDTFNSYPFTPLATYFGSRTMIMPVEGQQYIPGVEQSKNCPEPGLLACLEQASRQNGYRMLQLDSLVFKSMAQPRMGKVDNVQNVPFSQMSRQKRLDYLESMHVLKKIDSTLGSIVMCETNLADASGNMRTWVWFKILKPLLSTRGIVLQELTPIPEAWLDPPLETSQFNQGNGGSSAGLQADKLLPLPPHFGDIPRRRCISFQFSKGGCPSFSCSAKPVSFYERPLPGDFLWLENAPCSYWSGLSTEQYWDQLEEMAEFDRNSWRLVQEAMARFACIVDVKTTPGAGWVEFGPEGLQGAPYGQGLQPRQGLPPTAGIPPGFPTFRGLPPGFQPAQSFPPGQGIQRDLTLTNPEPRSCRSKMPGIERRIQPRPPRFREEREE
ncbi:hypothetical protein AK830_g1554 [Neonectria ditissima]|uniref:Uncharacterized protein n=1 Tax=Neonectria ditissima TaxID=78410 RepID=A0A0N8H8M9_9HYPO|nr:hypothetical protein AK830_g1554 [Neonectria ditissima]